MACAAVAVPEVPVDRVVLAMAFGAGGGRSPDPKEGLAQAVTAVRAMGAEDDFARETGLGGGESAGMRTICPGLPSRIQSRSSRVGSRTRTAPSDRKR